MRDKDLPRLPVVVERAEQIALGIKTFQLAGADGRILPPFTPGAHITLFLPGGLERRYSLCGSTGDTSRYLIAVLRKSGGSAWMHDALREGMAIEISHPHNDFALAPDAECSLLIAGGIGITPIVPMVRALVEGSEEFALHYCARSRQAAAFVDYLAAICRPEQLRLHFDGGDPRAGLDVGALIEACRRGTHVYCCGPASLMQTVKRVTSSWPTGTVHFESFTPMGDSDGYEISLRRSGQRLAVPPGGSMLHVLRAHGIDVETSCEAGTCGTCRTRYFSGEPIHNDFVLSDEERRQFLMVCCAGARGGVLELDL